MGIFDKAGSAVGRDTSDRDPYFEAGDAGTSIAILVSGKLIPKTKNGKTVVPVTFANLLHRPETVTGNPMTVGARRQYSWGPNQKKSPAAQAVADTIFKNLTSIILGAPGSDEKAADAVRVLATYLGQDPAVADSLEGVRLKNRRDEFMVDSMERLWGTGEGPSGQIVEVRVTRNTTDDGKVFANVDFRRIDAAEEAELREAVTSGAYAVPDYLKALVARGPATP